MTHQHFEHACILDIPMAIKQAAAGGSWPKGSRGCTKWHICTPGCSLFPTPPFCTAALLQAAADKVDVRPSATGPLCTTMANPTAALTAG